MSWPVSRENVPNILIGALHWVFIPIFMQKKYFSASELSSPVGWLFSSEEQKTVGSWRL